MVQLPSTPRPGSVASKKEQNETAKSSESAPGVQEGDEVQTAQDEQRPDTFQGQLSEAMEKVAEEEGEGQKTPEISN